MFKRLLSFMSAVVIAGSIMTINASAEQAPAPQAVSYSVGALSKPKITKAARYTDAVTLKWSSVKGARATSL